MEALIQEGEALTYAEAVDAFLAAGRHLLEIQRQAEPFQCVQLRNVRPDSDLEALLTRYEYREA
jgi:hypothetical protein